MKQAGPSRRLEIAFALAAALIATLGLFLFTDTGERPGTLAPVTAPPPEPVSSGREPVRPAVRPSSIPAPQHARDTSSQPRPTPSVFDFATIARSGERGKSKAEERFPTNERFTQEDLRHPERYFEFAERMPELNRPEERRDTLDYFLAYREQLGRDLEAAGDNHDKRQEILATIERYDDAIARLRKLVDTADTK